MSAPPKFPWSNYKCYGHRWTKAAGKEVWADDAGGRFVRIGQLWVHVIQCDPKHRHDWGRGSWEGDRWWVVVEGSKSRKVGASENSTVAFAPLTTTPFKTRTGAMRAAEKTFALIMQIAADMVDVTTNTTVAVKVR